MNERLESELQKGREWVAAFSEEALGHGSEIARETDRWFLLAIRGVSRGAERARVRLRALARVALGRFSRRSTTMPRERIRELLRTEAVRLHFDVSHPEFEVFAERMSALLELVFSGAIALEDVAFEPGEARSVEPTEEVSDREQDEQTNQGEPLAEAEPTAVADTGEARPIAQE